MKPKILGNWNDQHAARFNAMLSCNFMLIALAAVGFFYPIFVLAGMFFVANCLEMGGAYYFFHHPEKFPKRDEAK